MQADQQAARAANLEQLIERFAPINEDELALTVLDGDLPAWVLVATERTRPERAVIRPLHRLDAFPDQRFNGWAPLAIVSLDYDVAYVSGAFGRPGEISLSQLL